MAQDNFHNDYFIDEFLRMEETYHLFDITDDSGFAIWDILRFDLFLAYTFPEVSNQRSSKKGVVGKVLGALCKLPVSFFTLLFYKPEILFFNNARYKNKEGRYFDKAIEDIYRSEYHSKQCVFQYKPAISYVHPQEYDFLHLYRKIGLKNRSIDGASMQHIVEALKSIGPLKVSETYLNHLYNAFYKEYRYYSCYLRLKRPKLVVFNRNGLKKGLIAASHALQIPIVEVQHGMFSKIHLAYSYPEVGLIHLSSLFPDLFLTFSEYWAQAVHIPFPVLAVGNNYFTFPKRVDTSHDQQKMSQILIISSMIHSDAFRPLLEQFAKEYPQIKLIIKLHPNEFVNVTRYKSWYDSYPSIRILTDEVPLESLMATSELVLLINSTVFYEALSSHRKVAVFKAVNYEAYLNAFNLPNVYPVSSIAELMNAYNATYESYEYSFFKPFDVEAYLHATSELLASNNRIIKV